MSYTHLNRTERDLIYRMQFQGHSQSAIARTLGRHKSTISRELRRYRNVTGHWWSPEADLKAGLARRRHVSSPKTGSKRLINSVLRLLRQRWSPMQIANHLRTIEFLNEPSMWLSHERIYQYVWDDKARGGTLYKQFRRGGKRYRKRGRNTKSLGPIKNRVFITARPKHIEQRDRVGDWEGDTMVGRLMKGYIATFVERKSRLLVARLMPNKRAATLNQAALRAFGNISKDFIHTLTLDNGSEFAHFKELEQRLKVDVYFAHPYHSWERGTNENTNGLIRQYFPKKTDFTTITPAALNAVVHKLNNRPRKTLGYRTPIDVFNEAVVALRS